MSNDERRETVSYDDDKLHCWINGCQWVSITRVVQIRKDCNKEIALLSKEVKRLTSENEAYKILLKDKLNKEG